jgi:hypothetical protein
VDVASPTITRPEIDRIERVRIARAAYSSALTPAPDHFSRVAANGARPA